MSGTSVRYLSITSVMCGVCVCVREREGERESLEWVLCCLDERERERESLEWVLCCLDDACVPDACIIQTAQDPWTECQQPVKMLCLVSGIYPMQ